MSLFQGTLPGEDVVVCLIAVMFLAGILCTFFLPTTRRHRRHRRHACAHVGLLQAVAMVNSDGTPAVNQETYLDDPPERSQEAVMRPVLQSPDKCKTDYDLCMASVGPVNQQTVLTSKPVRVVSFPLDIVAGAERRLAGQAPPMAPLQMQQMPANLMTR